jgi:hypothetical protein
MRGLVRDRPLILGCVVTRWQDNKQNRDSVAALEQFFLVPNQISLLKTRINNDPNVQKDEGSHFHFPGLGQKPAALQYTSLAEEVLNNVNHD